MDIKKFDSAFDIANELFSEIKEIIEKKDAPVISLAAGHTSLELFKVLIELGNNKKVDFSKCIFVGLDEWVGLGRGDDGSCIEFLLNNLFSPLGIKEEQVVFYDGKGNMDQEISKVDKFIDAAGGIDFMLLGIGMNGHLGLNEPYCSFDTFSHIVELDETTQRVGQKYFSKQTAITKGITMGMKNLEQCKRIVLVATGEHKSEIIEKLYFSEIDYSLPASYLKKLPNVSLYADRHALKNIQAYI